MNRNTAYPTFMETPSEPLLWEASLNFQRKTLYINELYQLIDLHVAMGNPPFSEQLGYIILFYDHTYIITKLSDSMKDDIFYGTYRSLRQNFPGDYISYDDLHNPNNEQNILRELHESITIKNSINYHIFTEQSTVDKDSGVNSLNRSGAVAIYRMTVLQSETPIRALPNFDIFDTNIRNHFSDIINQTINHVTIYRSQLGEPCSVPIALFKRRILAHTDGFQSLDELSQVIPHAHTSAITTLVSPMHIRSLPHDDAITPVLLLLYSNHLLGTLRTHDYDIIFNIFYSDNNHNFHTRQTALFMLIWSSQQPPPFTPSLTNFGCRISFSAQSFIQISKSRAHFCVLRSSIYTPSLPTSLHSQQTFLSKLHRTHRLLAKFLLPYFRHNCRLRIGDQENNFFRQYFTLVSLVPQFRLVPRLFNYRSQINSWYASLTPELQEQFRQQYEHVHLEYSPADFWFQQTGISRSSVSRMDMISGMPAPLGDYPGSMLLDQYNFTYNDDEAPQSSISVTSPGFSSSPTSLQLQHNRDGIDEDNDSSSTESASSTTTVQSATIQPSDPHELR